MNRDLNRDMNPDTRTDPAAPAELDTFERALLTELRATVAHDAVRKVAVRRRSRVLTLGGVAAAAATAVGLSLTLGGGSPAFALHERSDGDVVVTINRLDDAAGLQAALADKGVDATVRYQGATVDQDAGGRFDPRDLPAGDHRFTDNDCQGLLGRTISVDPDGKFHLVVPVGRLRAGDHVTLLLAGSSVRDAATLIAIGNRSSGCVTQTGGDGSPSASAPTGWVRWTGDAAR